MKMIFCKGLTETFDGLKSRKGSKVLVQRTYGNRDFLDEAVLNEVQENNGSTRVIYTIMFRGKPVSKSIDLKNYGGDFAVYDPSLPKGAMFH